MMPKEPQVTMVAASFNHSTYVRQCLTSVRDQTLRHFDLIVTDDASQDNSQRVIREVLSELDLEARLIFHEENVGICRTFNEALAQVRTPYVCFLAMDDWMVANRLETQAAALSQLGAEVGLIYSDAWLADAEGHDLSSRFFDRVENRLRGTRRATYHELLRGNWIPAPSVMFRTDCARKVGGYDESLLFEDYDLWCRIARDFDLQYVSEPLVVYRQTPGSLSRTMRQSAEFHISNAKLLAKHYGRSVEVNDIVVPLIFKDAVAAYRSVADPKRLARFFKMNARQFPNLSNIVWALLPYFGRPAQRLVVRRRIRKGD